MEQQREYTTGLLLGRRVLAKIKQGYSDKIEELMVLEYSPSGNWIKFMNLNGNKFWRATSDFALIEILKDMKDGKPLV